MDRLHRGKLPSQYFTFFYSYLMFAKSMTLSYKIMYRHESSYTLLKLYMVGKISDLHHDTGTYV